MASVAAPLSWRPGFMFLSFLLRCFSLLFFRKTLLISRQPRLQILRGFFQFIAVEESTSQCFEERARADIVSKLLVRFLVGTFRNRNEELLVKSRQPAFNAPQ